MEIRENFVVCTSVAVQAPQLCGRGTLGLTSLMSFLLIWIQNCPFFLSLTSFVVDGREQGVIKENEVASWMGKKSWGFLHECCAEKRNEISSHFLLK